MLPHRLCIQFMATLLHSFATNLFTYLYVPTLSWNVCIIIIMCEWQCVSGSVWVCVCVPFCILDIFMRTGIILQMRISILLSHIQYACLLLCQVERESKCASVGDGRKKWKIVCDSDICCEIEFPHHPLLPMYSMQPPPSYITTGTYSPLEHIGMPSIEPNKCAERENMWDMIC